MLDPSCDEVHFARHIVPVAQRYCVGRGLDLGPGLDPYPGAIPVEDGGLYGIPADQKQDFRDLGAYSDMDYVFSSAALEHCAEWEKVLGEAFRCLRSGGWIFLYLPWDEYHAPWKPENCRGHAVSMNPGLVREALAVAGFVDIDGSMEPDSIASFWTVGRKP